MDHSARPAGREHRTGLRTAVTLLVAGLALTGATAGAAGLPNAPTAPIEQTFHTQGTWAVTAVPRFNCCDSSGAAFDVW
ncbi:MAG: hypothetical protein QOE72_1170, partial [Chloroflexota bacterium]|nr:hypothetical protein [Chloroflexota bacterium]